MLTDQQQAVDDVVDVGEDPLLRPRRGDGQLLAGEEPLAKDLDQRPVGAGALTRPVDVVEVGDREREAVPVAVVPDELGVGRLGERVRALVAAEAAVGELGRRARVDELRALRAPVLEHLERAVDVHVPDDVRLRQARLDTRVLTEVEDDVGLLGNGRTDVLRVRLAVVDAGEPRRRERP